LSLAHCVYLFCFLSTEVGLWMGVGKQPPRKLCQLRDSLVEGGICGGTRMDSTMTKIQQSNGVANLYTKMPHR